MDSLYETDFYTWATRQGASLRAGKADQADLANIAEEIEHWDGRKPPRSSRHTV